MEKVRITNSTIILTIIFVSLLLLALYARYIVVISLIGIGIGILIFPVLNFLSTRFKFPKFFSAMVVFLGIAMFMVLVLGSIYYLVADQLASLAERGPDLVDRLNGSMNMAFRQFPWLEQYFNDFSLEKYVRTGLGMFFRGFQTGFWAITGFGLAIVIGLYTAAEGQVYFTSLVEAFFPRHRERAESVLIDCAVVLRGWFKAQLVDMGLMGAITAVGLWLVGMEYWAVFALLTVVLGIIPYVGIILVVAASVLITLATDPSKVPWVLLVFTITQQLEGNLILPLVMRGKADLPVVPLLIFMMFLAAFFGLLGAFLATPLFAVLRTLYLDLYLPKINEGSI